MLQYTLKRKKKEEEMGDVGEKEEEQKLVLIFKKKLPNKNIFSFFIRRFIFSSSDSLWFFIFLSFFLSCNALFLQTSASLLIFLIWNRKKENEANITIRHILGCLLT